MKLSEILERDAVFEQVTYSFAVPEDRSRFVTWLTRVNRNVYTRLLSGQPDEVLAPAHRPHVYRFRTAVISGSSNFHVVVLMTNLSTAGLLMLREAATMAAASWSGIPAVRANDYVIYEGEHWHDPSVPLLKNVSKVGVE